MDFKPAFESFVKSPLGVELLRALKEDVHDSLIQKAEAATSMESSYGFTMQAAGVIKTIEHITSRAVL